MTLSETAQAVLIGVALVIIASLWRGRHRMAHVTMWARLIVFDVLILGGQLISSRGSWQADSTYAWLSINLACLGYAIHRYRHAQRERRAQMIGQTYSDAAKAMHALHEAMERRERLRNVDDA